MTVGTPSVIFLDRDGTIIRDVEYLARPEQVELLAGAAEAIARANQRGIPVILVTNQSGIGRGFFSHADYARGHDALVRALGAQGARIDGMYYCPHAPDDACDCRKPGAGMFRRALREHAIPPGGIPILIGDRWRDIAAAAELGGVGILVPSPATPADDIERAKHDASLASTLGEAFDRVLDEK
jgi:histidinol-phosphate phosphatase family protein